MTQSCIICNIIVSSTRINYVNIFGKDIHLQSKKKLWEVLSEVLEKTVAENTCHSRVLCKKCYSIITEYDSLQLRLQVLKANFINDFKNTLPQYNLKYDTYGQLVNIKPKVLPTKKIVLPASKLQPLPANYVIDVGKMANAKSNIAFANVENNGIPGLFKISSAMSLKASTTLQSTVANSQSKLMVTKSSETSPTNTVGHPSLVMPTITSNSMNTRSTKNPILSFNINALPKNFMSSTTVNKSDNISIKTELDSQNVVTDNDHSMEIDEECTLAVTADENGKLLFDTDEEKNKSIDLKSKTNFFDVGLLLSSDGSERESEKAGPYLLDKYTLLNDNDVDDDEEEETIVMENGDNTTIIRMAAGQRLLYDGKEISLVENSVDDLQDNDDSQDSNDDTQIELQVSGDEETANAIIAAAQEEGGAFIKVESGEMYRVESIRSKTEDENDTLHLQNIIERIGNIFKCLLCENIKTKDSLKCVGNAETMMAHLKSAHGARAYICPVCDHVMRKRSEYTVHLEEHAQKGKTMLNKTKLHECTVCKKKFNSKMLLKEHMNIHTGTRPYTCNACDKTFASKYTHQAHLKTHLARPRPFKCQQCEKTFFTQQNLTQHEKTHLGIKEFICTVCDKAFATQHNLEVHGVIHTGRKPYECPVCKKCFARRAEVRDHMRIHTGERPFACDVCGATFTQRSNLHSHKRATHLDDKRYECPQCPKRFKRRRLLDYHIKAAHTGERPLKCNVCRATFVYPEHYKKHKRIHSGEKPYECEVCGKTFNSRDNRNTHRFVHSDKKPYECLTCGAGYMRKQLLYQHMNTTGHVAESIVVNQPRVIKNTENGIIAPLVDVHTIEIKTNKLGDSIFETTDELELDENDVTSVVNTDADAAKLFMAENKKNIMQDKGTLNLVQDGDDQAFLTLHNLSGLIETTSEDKLDEPAQIITTDDKGGAMRLIQVQLQDGQTGWVAINHDHIQT